MKTCATCGFCYMDANNKGYRCMRGARDIVPDDLFLLNRMFCDQHSDSRLDLSKIKGSVKNDNGAINRKV